MIIHSEVTTHINKKVDRYANFLEELEWFLPAEITVVFNSKEKENITNGHLSMDSYS